MHRRSGKAALVRHGLLACTAGFAIVGSPVEAQTAAPIATTAGISPLFGRIHAFYGDIGAEFGRIHAFSGNLTPLFGRIHAFWGDPTTFWGSINPYNPPAGTSTGNGNSFDPFWGSNSPYTSKNGSFYSGINSFWTTQFSSWSTIMTSWSSAQTSNDAQNLANAMQNNLLNPINSFWGKVVSKQNADALTLVRGDLAANGVAFVNGNTIDPNSLLALTPTQQATMFLNVYDHLMNYAGTGHVDWWMGSIHTSPALAQINGSVPTGGSPPTIGMLDFVVTPNGQQVSKQVTQFGNTVFTDGHGAAVGSLIIGATDGSGVIGILPTGAANVAVYNPYDATGTTNWTDVGTGVATLVKAVFTNSTTPVGVLNASLGVPGWTLHPGWNDALTNANAHGHDLVIAAGNDGVQQTANVPWSFANNPTLLIVGSVGADGTISQFSNTPGEACLLPTSNSSTVCSEANKLKYRFIVAPGELILVSDGNGGHYRQSGTSLAAPLVSGTIALLQNRWPWLSNYPDETASIIFKSATPLGTQPGADPVYGVGELNVAASQAPIDWSKVVFIPGGDPNGATAKGLAAITARLAVGLNPLGSNPSLPSGSPSTISWSTIAVTGVPLNVVSTQLASSSQSSWDAAGLYYTAFEPIGNTFRDFQIPLSSRLVGQTATTMAGGQLYQSYLTAAFHAQAGHYAGLNVPTQDSILTNGFARSAMPAGAVGTMQLRVAVTSAPPPLGFRSTNGSIRFDTGAALIGEKSALTFGFGNGASALDTSDSFSFATDHDLATGGANPVLGLASGGSYLGARTLIAPGLTVGMGVTQRDVWRNPMAFGLDTQQTGAWVNRYAANAQTLNADYLLGRGLTAHVSFTHLDERTALLGVQSVDRNDLAGGSSTTATTMGLDVRLGHGFVLSGSGTIARTHAGGGQITTDQLTSAATELALTKNGIFGYHDQLRFTAANPLHTVGGQLRYSSIGVVDRQTGALGLVTQSVEANRGMMPLVTEVSYGRSLAGRGEVSLFGRYQQGVQLTQGNNLGTMGGVQLHLAF
jgi:hypothetical protein